MSWSERNPVAQDYCLSSGTRLTNFFCIPWTLLGIWQSPRGALNPREISPAT